MSKDSIQGNDNVYIKNVSNSHIEIIVEGEKKEVPNQFNEILTRKLLEALLPINPGVKQFIEIEIASQDSSEWNHKVKTKAKDRILKSYDGGILNVHLQKLMSIGKEPLQEDKFQKYIDRCLKTAKCALRILSISMICKLWAIKCKENISLHQDRLEELKKKFFESYFENDIATELELLQILLDLFKKHSFEFPIPEIAALEDDLQPKSDFDFDCAKLREIEKDLNSKPSTLSTCRDAETLLASILARLAFLSNYKMASIKGIAYKQLPHETPNFIHNYAEIGNYSRAKENYLTIKKGVWTDAVLLYKDDYLENINLYPFVIDLNTIKSEGGSKIYLYSHCNSGEPENSITYNFIDNESDPLTVPDPHKDEGLIKALLKFYEAKNTIFG